MTEASHTEATILLTGATGFVGRALWPVLTAAGYKVRCVTRDVRRARAALPDRDWVEGDVADERSIAQALRGCQAMFYLVHGMADGRDDFRQRECASARVVARMAHAANLQRIVYLGGVAAPHGGSEHLGSRMEVGNILRAGPVPTIELRASMIVGHGSLSWLIVRDLAARLPVMVLPSWLKSRTEPVAIDDVVAALLGALRLPAAPSAHYDIPGPAVLSGEQILEQSAAAMGLHRPRMLRVPLLTPRLSSLWVRFVTRARWSVAREIVVGLTEDLLAADAHYWKPHRSPHAPSVCRSGQAGAGGGKARGTGSRHLGHRGASECAGDPAVMSAAEVNNPVPQSATSDARLGGAGVRDLAGRRDSGAPRWRVDRGGQRGDSARHCGALDCPAESRCGTSCVRLYKSW